MLTFKPNFQKKVAMALATSLATFTLFFSSPVVPNVQAESASSQTTRIAGSTRFETALEISKTGWAQAPAVVLARGDDYPDALAGAILAHSSQVQGPLLLTDSASLSAGVLDEIKRLGAEKVYILGGTGAVSSGAEASLKTQNLTVERLSGDDRYQTAAAIAQKAVPQASQAYLASGNSFADALSISSYAANKGIPLLLTEQKTVPEVTLNALKALGVTSVALIGGEGVIEPSVENALKAQGISVTRMSGLDRYATNLDVLNTLNYDRSNIYVATGEDFPDALAGAVLAAKQGNPIVLVPKSAKDLSSGTTGYLGVRRIDRSSFTLLGGVGVIPFGIENLIRTGSQQSRISLQYLQAYGTGTDPAKNLYDNYVAEINSIPGNATDTVDWLAPNWYRINLIPDGKTTADGSFSGPWAKANEFYAPLTVNAAHARGLKVLPSITADFNNKGQATLDYILANPSARQNLIQNINTMLQSTGADGVIIDFEFISDDSGANLTQFMKELYASLHPQNKLVVQAVNARTSATDWNQEYDYKALSETVDYLNIMTYDLSTSSPGPIAPLSWVKKVLNFTQSQGVNMNKVLLGIPYYGRDWSPSGASTYNRTSVSLGAARNLMTKYGATPSRETSADDPVGIPTFSYTDENKIAHTVYYDDIASLDAKLELVNNYNLGGAAAWSLFWVNNDTAKEIFPLWQQHVR